MMQGRDPFLNFLFSKSTKQDLLFKDKEWMRFTEYCFDTFKGQSEEPCV